MPKISKFPVWAPSALLDLTRSAFSQLQILKGHIMHQWNFNTLGQLMAELLMVYLVYCPIFGGRFQRSTSQKGVDQTTLNLRIAYSRPQYTQPFTVMTTAYSRPQYTQPFTVMTMAYSRPQYTQPFTVMTTAYSRPQCTQPFTVMTTAYSRPQYTQPFTVMTTEHFLWTTYHQI